MNKNLIMGQFLNSPLNTRMQFLKFIKMIKHFKIFHKLLSAHFPNLSLFLC